jgi:hypothetical protein
VAPDIFLSHLNVSLVRPLVEVQRLVIGLMARKIDTLKNGGMGQETLPNFFIWISLHYSYTDFHDAGRLFG